MAEIIELNGNIFDSKCQTIVNTVNCVGVMGKGIAYEYRLRYPEMFNAYVDLCSHGKLQPGLLFLWKKSNPWVLNFPTKNNWKYPSKIEYIEKGLKKFALTYIEKGIQSIAFPQLGTSSGGLPWPKIREIIFRYLKPLPELSIEIYQYDPHAKDSYFEILNYYIEKYSVNDFAINTGISKKQAEIIHSKINKCVIKNMLDLQKTQGVGKVALEKIYNFIDIKKSRKKIQKKAEQLTFWELINGPL
jgi:O-acetyl-ADP-ribose deacetylase (regulator of RNase III)